MSASTYVYIPAAGVYAKLSDVFDAFRSAGVTPYGGSGADDDVAAAILAALASIESLGGSSGTPEESVPASATLGVAASVFPTFNPTDTSYDFGNVHKMGNCFQMLADSVRMGASRFRTVGQCDILWANLFAAGGSPDNSYVYGDTVYTPWEILSAISDTDYGVLAWATELLIGALCMGAKIDFKMFNQGAGTDLNKNAVDLSTAVTNAEYVTENGTTNSGTLWSDLTAAQPPWQTGLIVPSGLGWDDWYHNWSSLPWMPSTSSPPPSGAEAPYAQYVLSVWPTESTSHATRSPALLESARRKCFGVLAYSTAIARWLSGVNDALLAVPTTTTPADLDPVLTTGILNVYNVVEVLELCNETDAFFALPPSSAGTQPISGALEVGRFLALLAGPVAHALPGMKFRTELATWQTTSHTPPFADNGADKIEWLRLVISEGMVAEARRWQSLATLRGTTPPNPEVRAWFATEKMVHEASTDGFFWPPESPPTAGSLLHQIGWHWYRVQDTSVSTRGVVTPEVWQYADTVRLHSDMNSLHLLANASTRIGFALQITCMEIGFQAAYPAKASSFSRTTNYYAGTSTTLHASMVVRLVATLVASGVASMAWFTFMEGPTPVSSEVGGMIGVTALPPTNTMSLHNDIVLSSSSYVQGTNCWPRPAWFAWRRLAWLLSQTGSTHRRACRVVASRQGLTVIEIQFSSPLVGGPDGTALGSGVTKGTWSGWERCYLMWLDQYATNTQLHPYFPRSAGSADVAFRAHGRAVSLVPTDEYELLPIVPGDVAASGTDANGYAAATPGTADWAWVVGATDWADALASATSTVNALTMTINICDPASGTGLAPLCMLTNLYFAAAPP